MTVEAAVCLRAQEIYDDDGSVGGGRGIDDASEGLETTMEVARA